MKKKKVLFVCIHNSARSQMAETFLNNLCGHEFEAHSAGIEPGKLNPVVVEAMRELGFDLSHNQTKAVSGMLNSGQRFDYVITVCDETSAERCLVFPGTTKRLHWGFPDPSALTGPPDQRLEGTRKIRDAIRAQAESWCEELCGERMESRL